MTKKTPFAEDPFGVTPSHKYNLGFISDLHLFQLVKETLKQFKMSINLKSYEKNIIDPIRMTLEIHAYRTTPEQAVDREIARQLGKTIEGAVGWFHQHLFDYINGWEVPDDGVDVMNHNGTIFGEIKNKYNTMNSSSAEKVFEKLKGIVVGNPKAIAYLIEVIAKKSQDVEWSIAGQYLQPNKACRLRQISIDRFMALATGDKLAFYKLCSVLGLVVDDVLAAYPSGSFKNTVIHELYERNPDIIKGMFLSSFGTYLGFEKFEERKV